MSKKKKNMKKLAPLPSSSMSYKLAMNQVNRLKNFEVFISRHLKFTNNFKMGRFFTL